MSDNEFLTHVEDLHDHALHQCFGNSAPVSDGVAVVGVDFQANQKISADFQLWLFTQLIGSTGHSAAPARFTVCTRDGMRFKATFGCGLRDPKGHFLFPRNSKNAGRHDRPPTTIGDWAFYHEKIIGPPSLKEWRKRNLEKQGDCKSSGLNHL